MDYRNIAITIINPIKHIIVLSGAGKVALYEVIVHDAALLSFYIYYPLFLSLKLSLVAYISSKIVNVVAVHITKIII